MDKKELAFTTRLTREDVAGVVEALVEGLKEGHLNVQKSGDNLEIDVPRVVDLEVKASLEEEKAEFIVEVSWRPNRAENPDRPDENDPPEPVGKKDATAGTSPRKEAKASMREAAEAARAAAKNAGRAVKKTARAAKVLVKESREKIKTETRELKENNPGGLFKQMAGAVEDAARRARQAMQEIVSDANRGREERKADAAPVQETVAAPVHEADAMTEASLVAEVNETTIPEKAEEKPQGDSEVAVKTEKSGTAAKAPGKKAAGKSAAAKPAAKAKGEGDAKAAKKTPAVKRATASEAKKTAAPKKTDGKTGAKSSAPKTAKPE